MTQAVYENIRTQIWERKFPGCTSEFIKVFGTVLPSPKAVAEWKGSWVESTPHVCELAYSDAGVGFSDDGALRARVYAVAERTGLHPYFWEYNRKVVHIDTPRSDLVTTSIVIVTPTVTFFYEEHLVMFKLAW